MTAPQGRGRVRGIGGTLREGVGGAGLSDVQGGRCTSDTEGGVRGRRWGTCLLGACTPDSRHNLRTHEGEGSGAPG